MQTAVAFRFRDPEWLCLFPAIKFLYSFEDERWSEIDNPNQFSERHKQDLSERMRLLGFTEQNVDGELWSFANPASKQTYYYYWKYHQRFKHMPGYLLDKLREADTLFSDMLVSASILKRMPNLKHFVGMSTSHYNPDSEDWDDDERKREPITFFLWNTPGYLQQYFAVHYPHNFPYHRPERITADYIRTNCLVTQHPSLRAMSEHYRNDREEPLDSEPESEDEKQKE